MEKKVGSCLVRVLIGLAAGVMAGRRIPSAVKPPSNSAPSSLAKTNLKPLPNVDPRTNLAGAKNNAGAEKKRLPEDLESAFQAVLKMSNMRRFEALNTFIQSLDAAEMPRVMAWIQKISSLQFRQQALYALLAHWGETDPKAAMAAADATPGKAIRDQAIVTVLGAWAQKDPDGALAWVKQLPRSPLLDQAIQTIISSVAGSRMALPLARPQTPAPNMLPININ